MNIELYYCENQLKSNKERIIPWIIIEKFVTLPDV